MKHLICLFFIAAFAYSQLVSAQNRSPDVPRAIAIGDRHFNRGKYKEALAEYYKGAPTPELQRRIGATYIKLWDMPSAIETLREALKGQADDVECKLLLAEALSWNKDFGEAAAIYEEAIAAGYTTEKARLDYGRTLSWMKHFHEATEQYQTAIAENPSSYEAFLGLGRVLSWRKMYAQSLDAYRKAVSLTDDPQQKSAALTRIGEVHVWNGDFSAARIAWGEAFNLDARNVEALFGAGELDEWTGDYKEAKRRYEKVLAIQPDHKTAKAKLLQLLWVK